VEALQVGATKAWRDTTYPYLLLDEPIRSTTNQTNDQSDQRPIRPTTNQTNDQSDQRRMELAKASKSPNLNFLALSTSTPKSRKTSQNQQIICRRPPQLKPPQHWFREHIHSHGHKVKQLENMPAGPATKAHHNTTLPHLFRSSTTTERFVASGKLSRSKSNQISQFARPNETSRLTCFSSHSLTAPQHSRQQPLDPLQIHPAE
jgi:hypothetical protein